MENNKKAALAVACTLGASLGYTNSMAAPVLSEDGSHYYDDDIVIATRVDPLDPNNLSQMALPANIRLPNTNDPNQEFPLVIFINSWTLDEYEYGIQARKLARKGYAVLSYSTRGFGGAPGLVDTAGEKDVFDARQVISFALDNYPIDPDGIALGGVSYGAGISLVTGFQDERVDAIVSMSGWGSLVESLWAGDTANETWINLLVNSGNLMGDLDPIIEYNYNNMKQHQNIAETKAWGQIRSPLNYLEQVNARENPPALFVSNNLHDYLFHPNSMVELLSSYKGPWRSQFNFGIHGQGEAAGLTDPDATNVPWIEAHHWLDHYLKGIDNGIDQLKPVNTVVRSRDFHLPGLRESFDGFPIAKTSGMKTYYLAPVNGDFGGLNSSEDLEFMSLNFDTTDSIVWTSALQGALIGEGHNYPLNAIDFNHSAAFISEPLSRDMLIRGEINLEIWAEIEEKSQYFAYLLEYDPDKDWAVFVGHAPFSWHSSEQGELPQGPTKLSLEFYWTAYDINAGNNLILVIEGKDGDYWRYEDTPENNTLVFGPEQIGKLMIPTIPAPVSYQSVDDPDGSETDPDSNARGLDGNSKDLGDSSAGSISTWLLIIFGWLGLSRSRLYYTKL